MLSSSVSSCSKASPEIQKTSKSIHFAGVTIRAREEKSLIRVEETIHQTASLSVGSNSKGFDRRERGRGILT